MNLDHLEHHLPQSAEEITCKIAEAREQLNNPSSDIHALTHRLHSPKLDYLGLAAAAKSLCKELSIR